MDAGSLVRQWRQYAIANRTHAANCERDGDLFGAELSLTRADVRQHAAELLQRAVSDPLDAAEEMHRRATALWQHTLPLIGFDEAALKYTRARTWQDCARAIDSSLPIVQPRLLADPPSPDDVVPGDEPRGEA